MASFARTVGTPRAQTIVERIGESPATPAACEIRALGGAMARVPALSSDNLFRLDQNIPPDA